MALSDWRSIFWVNQRLIVFNPMFAPLAKLGPGRDRGLSVSLRKYLRQSAHPGTHDDDKSLVIGTSGVRAMSALPSTVQTSLGRTLHLTKQIGKGGEGAIYETKGQNDIAVKLYWPNKAQSRHDKIVAMASAQFYKTNSFVAFPIEVLFAPNGAFAGFAMKKIGASKPICCIRLQAARWNSAARTISSWSEPQRISRGGGQHACVRMRHR